MDKSTQLQVRVTSQQKALIRAAAVHAGTDMSDWVLSRLFAAGEQRLRAALAELAAATAASATAAPRALGGGDAAALAASTLAMAAVIDAVAALAPAELGALPHPAEFGQLDAYYANYVCALIEQRAGQNGLELPAWTAHVMPLPAPVFPAGLDSLRLYLLRAAPVAFRRRNIFVDAGVDARV